MERSFQVFADYFQVVLHDSWSDWTDLPDRWTPETVDAMYVQGRDYVAIGTARNMSVPLTVRAEASDPDLDRGDWERIVDGEMDVPSGVLVVTGVTDNGATGGRVDVTPGAYRVRVLYAGLDTLSYDGLTGRDRYEVHLWPR